MKFWAVHETDVVPSHRTLLWWGSLVLAGFEAFLGCWLLAGFWIRTARVFTLVLFGAFAIVAAYQVVQGRGSCGCFGNLHVHPFITLILDLVVLVAVCRVPAIHRPEPRPRFSAACLLGFKLLSISVSIWVIDHATSLGRGLSLDTNLHDFGDVEQNVVLKHEFKLSNNCPFPVEIVRSVSSCACSTLEQVDGREIGIGEVISLPVVLRTQENEDELIGRFTLYCRRVSGTKSPTFYHDLVVKANVQPDYRVRPLIVDFGEIGTFGPSSRIVRLRPFRMPDVQVSRVQATNPTITARILSNKTTEGDTQIEVTFNGSRLNQSRTIDSPVIVDTTSRRRPSISILATAKFVAPIVIDPEVIVFAADEAGEVSREILVSSAREISIADTKVMSSDLKVSTTMDSPTSWRVRVYSTQKAELSGCSSEVRIRVQTRVESTAACEERVVAVPVYRLPKQGANQ